MLTGKNCRNNSVPRRICKKRILAISGHTVVDRKGLICLLSINFLLTVFAQPTEALQMFEQGNSSNRKIGRLASYVLLNKFYGKMRVLNVFITSPLKQVFWKTKTFFEKVEYCLLVQCTTIQNAIFPKLLCQKSVLRQIEWVTLKHGVPHWCTLM